MIGSTNFPEGRNAHLAICAVPGSFSGSIHPRGVWTLLLLRMESLGCLQQSRGSKDGEESLLSRMEIVKKKRKFL